MPALGTFPNPGASTGPGAVTFPTVGPNSSHDPSLAPSPVTLPSPEHARLANAAAEFPLDGRLLGIQLAGLAALAAAVIIAVARLSLRRRAPRHGKDPG